MSVYTVTAQNSSNWENGEDPSVEIYDNKKAAELAAEEIREELDSDSLMYVRVRPHVVRSE